MSALTYVLTGVLFYLCFLTRALARVLSCVCSHMRAQSMLSYVRPRVCALTVVLSGGLVFAHIRVVLCVCPHMCPLMCLLTYVLSCMCACSEVQKLV